jgi:hypothetical protein
MCRSSAKLFASGHLRSKDFQQPFKLLGAFEALPNDLVYSVQPVCSIIGDPSNPFRGKSQLLPIGSALSRVVFDLLQWPPFRASLIRSRRRGHIEESRPSL